MSDPFTENLNETTDPQPGDWMDIVDVSADASDRDRKLSLTRLAIITGVLNTGRLNLKSNSASNPAGRFEGASGQTAPVIEARNNAGTLLGGIGPNGNVFGLANQGVYVVPRPATIVAGQTWTITIANNDSDTRGASFIVSLGLTRAGTPAHFINYMAAVGARFQGATTTALSSTNVLINQSSADVTLTGPTAGTNNLTFTIACTGSTNLNRGEGMVILGAFNHNWFTISSVIA